MNAKVIDHLSIEDYHKDREYLTKTLLSALVDNPARFLWARNGGREEDTKPQIKGTAAHCYAMQPELWDQEFLSMPDFKPNGKQFRKDKRDAEYLEILKIANGRKIIKDSEVAATKRLGAALLASDKARPLLTGNILVEQTICWERSNRILLKQRPDIIRLDDDRIVDMKGTGRGKPEAFFRVASDKNYDLSVAMAAEAYQEAFGRPLKDYVFLTFEMKDPFLIELYSAFQPMGPQEGSYLQYGQVKLEQTLECYQECMVSGKWPSYTEGINPMRIPDYTMRQINRQLDEELAADD